MKIERPRGTRDFGPEEMKLRGHIEDSIVSVFERFNYGRIETPVFEHAELFELKSGDEIREHMYVFSDKGGRDLCLRPEMTASVCRMFASELRTRKKPVKLYYGGPMFRYERPQRGRYREFRQIGVELIGPDSPKSDAEIITVACESLKKLGLRFSLEVGHVGVLHGLLKDFKDDGMVFTLIDKGDFAELGKLVKDENFHKILKLKGGAEVLEKAEGLLDNNSEALAAIVELKEVVKWLDMDFKINLGIARGIEYYTGMVFEIRVDSLGAQNQICGGGRYDNLIGSLGGPDTPAVGFAFGFDRVAEAFGEHGLAAPAGRDLIAIAVTEDGMEGEAWKLSSRLRRELDNFSVDVDLMDRNLKKTLEHASDIGARYAVIVGKKEFAEKKVVLKDMKTGEQKTVEIKKLKDLL